jgi:16S rRNA (guanine966-N2)-methyltransferase
MRAPRGSRSTARHLVARPRPAQDPQVTDAGRVIAGSARGIRLVAPGEGTRPLADRVKQTLFAILEPDLRGAAVLDLFAGSGAAGIEALSRGAARAVFVERDRAAIAAIDQNLRRTRLVGERARVVRADALGWLTADGPAAGPFDVVIVDPPYADAEALAAALRRLGDPGSLGRLVAPAARVVAKHFWRDRPGERIGLLASERERRFGETALTFYRVAEEDR